MMPENHSCHRSPFFSYEQVCVSIGSKSYTCQENIYGKKYISPKPFLLNIFMCVCIEYNFQIFSNINPNMSIIIIIKFVINFFRTLNIDENTDLMHEKIICNQKGKEKKL